MVGEESREELVAKRERTVTLITVFSIGAIVMMFGSLISAVIVSKMDKFWVNLWLPTAFTFSTLLILLSSVTIWGALRLAKKDNKKGAQLLVALTLLLGIGFIGFQIKGWTALIEAGNRVKSGIFFQYGAYGEKYTLTKDGQTIRFDGDNYRLGGEILKDDEVNELRDFIYPICQEERKFRERKYAIENYTHPYGILQVTKSGSFKPLAFKEGIFFLENEPLSTIDLDALFKFAFGVYHETPFFGMKGKYGHDFTISLNGKELEFEDKGLFFPAVEIPEENQKKINTSFYQNGKDYTIKNGTVFQGEQKVNLANFEGFFKYGTKDISIRKGKWTQERQEIAAGQYNEFYQAGNVASSYIYVLTFLHALHILLGFGILVILLIRTQKGYYNSNNVIGLKAGGLFWHFLGGLWLFLFLFWMTITI